MSSRQRLSATLLVALLVVATWMIHRAGPAGTDAARAPAGSDRLPGRGSPVATVPAADSVTAAVAEPAGAVIADNATRDLRQTLRAGRPLTLAIDGEAPLELALRPSDVLAQGFRASLGADGPALALPAEAWVGRVLEPGGLGPRVALSVVGESLALHVDDPGGAWHVRSDPSRPGKLLAGRQRAPRELAEPGPVAAVRGTLLDRWAAEQRAPACELHPAEGKRPGLAVSRLPAGAPDAEVELVLAASLQPSASVAGEVETSLDSQTVIPRGRLYDLSLPDLMLLFVLDKATTGSDTSPAALGAKVSTYLTLAATVAGVYEEQLGLRLRLQEIILNPDTTAYTDPGQNLDAFNTWLNANRSWFTYRWSHAARFGIVDGSAGSVIGRAYVGTTGTNWGLSENETTYGYTLLTHELGHSVGSSHTSGGVMNASYASNQRNFFRTATDEAVTGAYQVSRNMSEPGLTYGSALLRDATQIPFGQDDFVSTAAGQPVTFAPLANDYAAVPGGAVNTLRLVEVSAVHPASAGTAARDGSSITFTPSPGFTGVAWFSYTLGGDVGRNGQGWLHRGDVAVTVGGNATNPPVPPALLAQDDVVPYDPAGGLVLVNPLVNDLGPGARYAGEVPQLLGPAGADQDLVGTSLWLTGVTLVQGQGGGALAALPMTVGGASVLAPSGVIVYEPAAAEPSDVVLTYTLRDATGATGGATITLVRGEYVNAFASGAPSEEGPGAGTFAIRPTTPRAGALVVPFRVTGTAVAGTDYALAGATSFDTATGVGTITIPALAAEAVLTVTAIDDAATEGVETVQLAVVAAEGVEPGSFSVASLGIVDDETPDSFTEPFAGATNPFDLRNRSLVFVPNATKGYRRFVSSTSVNAFPVDPAGATTVTLSDDSFATIDLADGKSFPFAGSARTRLFLGSNGYVTFGTGDTNVTESAANHFNRARISLLYDDLDPSVGGRVSRQQLADRWVMTFENVPEWNTSSSNSFQLELFFDGAIRMTWLRVDAVDGLAGLSSGGGTPVGYAPSDLSASPARAPGVPGLLATVAGAGLEEGAGPGQLVLAARDAPVAPVTVTVGAGAGLSPASSQAVLSSASPSATAVVAVNDGLAEGAHGATVTFSLASADLAYQGLVVPSLAVPIVDNAAPSVTRVSPGSASVAVPSASLGLVLDADAADDGVPSDGALAVGWSIISGPEGATISEAGLSGTGTAVARFPGTGGRWVLRATASDGASQASTDLDVTVGATATAAAADGRPSTADAVPLATGVARLDLPFGLDAGAAGATGLAWSVQARPTAGAKATFDDSGAAQPAATLGAPGTWTLRLSATNASGTVVADLPVEVGYADVAAWSAAVFADLPGGATDPLAADDADADGDGLPNLLEFALRTDPRSPESSESAVTVGGDDRLGLLVRRLAGGGSGNLVDGYTVLGVTLVAEATSDFVTWRRGAAAVQEASSPTPDGLGGETVLLQAVVPLATAPQFLRIVATRATP